MTGTEAKQSAQTQTALPLFQTVLLLCAQPQDDHSSLTSYKVTSLMITEHLAV